MEEVNGATTSDVIMNRHYRCLQCGALLNGGVMPRSTRVWLCRSHESDPEALERLEGWLRRSAQRRGA